MSRFRLNTSLVVAAMANKTIEPTIDERTGTMMRPSHLLPVARPFPKFPGCRMTFCREKTRCGCSCRKCSRECIYRDAEARTDQFGVVHIVHADGEPIAVLPKAEYEELMQRFGDLRLVAALRVTPG